MTKKNVDHMLLKLISKTHSDNNIWDLSSFHEFCSSNGYDKSKRTLDREITELEFYSKVLFDGNDLLLKKNIYKAWKEICISKRLLSLKLSISIFNNNLFIFYEDSTCLVILFDEDSDSIRQITGDYELNHTKNPILLNIKNIPELPYPLYSILHFINNDLIKLSKFSPQWRVRPIAFDYKSDILLKRNIFINNIIYF